MTSPAEGSDSRVDYYDGTTFWNNLDAVVRTMAERVSGSESEWWTAYFQRTHCPTPRRHGLVIGCGNGWVERDLVDLGIVSRVDAFDIDPVNIEAARAECGERNITYSLSSFEELVAAPNTYDLIVNVAALHHARYLYATCERLAESLTDDGVFVHWEYVGPSRNQYTRRQVAAMESVRAELPERFRSPYALRHDVLMMTAADPTEAVHSSEITRAIRLFFDVVEQRHVGGAIAYQLLWNNTAEFALGDAEAARWLDHVISRDGQAISTPGVGSFFDYIVARRPRQATWSVERIWWRHVVEPLRERLVRRTGNLYPTELVLLARDRRAWHPAVFRRALRRGARLLRRGAINR